MTVERKKVSPGTMTEREALSVAFDGSPEDWQAVRTLVDRDFSFEGLYAKRFEHAARGTLHDAGIAGPHLKNPDGREAWGWRAVVKLKGYPVDSKEDFAARIVEAIGMVRAAVAANNAADAARFAVELGALCTAASLKLEWEQFAIPGRKIVERSRENRDRHNLTRRRDAGDWQARAQEIASALWAKDPSRSKAAVATNVRVALAKQGCDRSISTIRQVIQKPDGAR